MDVDRTVLVHYHEIGLKGRNRGDFERRLETNLRRAIAGLTEGRVRRIASRLLVPVTDPGRADEVIAAVARTPGVSHLGYAIECDRTAEAIDQAALHAVAEETARRDAEVRTFAVESRRSATDYPEPSSAINRRVGDTIRRVTGLAVDLSAPDLTCRIEVVQARAYVYTRRVEGPGGLPVGVSGTVAALMSAGIDSPVAAWRMIKRGAVVVGVHFSGRPQTPAHSEHYAHELARVLDRFGGMSRLYTVPFGDVQRRIALDTPEDLRILLYRRFMVRVAEVVARRERAKALVTGESLGQVASQTLDNIMVVDAVATLPVLRPLVGSDKREITDEARAIGTFELSTASDDDCCTLFMPRRPATHATIEELDQAEAELDIEGLVTEALDGATFVDFSRAPRRRAT
jgi:thiamine biosynthesis protein ThiI